MFYVAYRTLLVIFCVLKFHIVDFYGMFTYSPTWRLKMHVLCKVYARNTPGSICQYKEDGLVSRPPSLFTSMRRPMHGTSCPKSQLKSTWPCLTSKFGSFLDHAETGEKVQNVISSSVQHPISLIFAIHVSLNHTFTNDVDFVDKAYAEICDHSLFTLQFR